MNEVFFPARRERDHEHPTQHERQVVQAIARAHRDVPFYKRHARPVPDDSAELGPLLATLPLLTKQQMRASLPKQWVAADVDLKADLASGAIELVETGGTTGERLRILRDRGWSAHQRTRAMHLHPAMARALDDHATYREAVLTTPLTGIGTCHTGDPPMDARVLGAQLHLSTRSDPTYWKPVVCDRMLDELEQHRTVGLEADPMYFATLARYAAKNSRKMAISAFAALTYSSASTGDRRAIERVYQGPLVQVYGAAETGVLFVQGEDGLLHHAPATTHVELLPAKVATPGAENVALVVVTTLDRRAQPLVRFVLGDLVQVAAAGTSKDTNVPSLTSIEGRVQDALVRPDGALVTAGAIDRALDLPGLARFQATQSAAEHVEVDLVVEDGADASSVRDRAAERLAPLFTGFHASVRLAQALAMEPSGRFRLARRSTPLDLAAAFNGFAEAAS